MIYNILARIEKVRLGETEINKHQVIDLRYVRNYNEKKQIVNILVEVLNGTLSRPLELLTIFGFDDDFNEEFTSVLNALKVSGCHLRALSLGQNDMGPVVFATFLDFIRTAKLPLETLRIGTRFDYRKIDDVMGALVHASFSLKELHIVDESCDDRCRGYCHTGDICVKEVISGLRKMKQPPRILYINVHTGDRGVKYIAEAIKNPRYPLYSLGLGFRIDITDNGAQLLAAALKSPGCRLRDLSVRYSGIKSYGICMLADALKITKCELVEYIYYDINGCEPSVIKVFWKMMRISTKNKRVLYNTSLIV